MIPASGDAAGKPPGIADALAHWGRGLAVAIALLYVAGFVVIGAYLGSYGVRDLEPIRTRYVSAAIPFLALAVLAAIEAHQLFDALHRLARGRSLPLRVGAFIGGFVLTVGAASVTTVFVLSVLRVAEVSLGQWNWAYVAAVVTFDSGAFLVLFTYRRRREDFRTWFGASQSLLGLSSLVLGVLAYATVIYPSLPTWVGGGKPDIVEISGDDIAGCPPCTSGPVRLIDDDSLRVVVVVDRPDGTLQAVEIARSHVRTISHHPVPKAP